MCGRCEELEGLVDYYKRELGILHRLADRAALEQVVHLPPTQAAILLALYGRRGATLSKDGLMAVLYSDRAGEEPEIKIVDVFISKLRKAIGRDKIITHWGVGYRLSPEGLAWVAQALAAGAPKAAPTAPEQVAA